MSQNICIDDLSDAIEKELMLYAETVLEGVNEKAEKAIKKLVKETKETAPTGNRKRQKYKNSITSKKIDSSINSIAYLWYVKAPNHRLSHLLNNGHALRDGGRYEGTGFITNAEKKIVEEYEKDIEEVIENG